LGDDIQAIKAGILEIADILVVNKADLPGADNTMRALNGMLEVAYAEERPERWRPALIRAAAASGEGIEAIYAAIQAHAAFLRRYGGWQEREKARLQTEFEALMRASLWERWVARVGQSRLDEMLRRIALRKTTPYAALNEFMQDEDNHA
jgi:LAO/AO transport system kinase